MRFLPALLLVAAALAGCAGAGDGGPPPAADPTTGSIRGLVVDQAINPVPGAKVTILAGPGAGETTETNDAGAFGFRDLAPGDALLSIGKPGFLSGVQASVTVVAGEDEPDVLKVLLERVASASPYLVHYKLDGYYSCAFALAFITDSCEFGYRTAWDELNHSGVTPPVPRNLQDFANTQYLDVGTDAFTIVQEGFWDNEAVPSLWIMVDATPIDNGCDCSDTYGNRIGPSPLLNRLDRYAPDGSEEFTRTNDADGRAVGDFPAGATVASRGFIPFQETPLGNQDPNSWAATGVAFQFVILTTTFHNYVPDPAWTFETRDAYDVG